MDPDLPKYINYWITTSTKHDCFFDVGPDFEPKVRIGAIKFLLVSHSEVFQRMLEESPLGGNDIVPVKDSDSDTFINFLKCIYGGTDVVVRKLSYDKNMNLLYLCEKYLALEIKEKISSLILQLYQPLSVDNAMISLSNPASLTNPNDRLATAITKLIQNNTEQILNHKSFLDLDLNAVEFILKQDIISTNEVNLWKAVLKWAQEKASSEDPKAIRSHLGKILKHIRFCAMDAHDFCESVVPSKVLTMEEVFEINVSIGTKTPLKLDGLCSLVLDRMKIPTSELTFIHVFHNIKDLTGPVNSPKYNLGDFNWYIQVSKNEGNMLGVYVCCSSARFLGSWKCLANFGFLLVNHMNKKRNLTGPIKFYEFNSEGSYGWGNPQFLSFQDLTNIENGYIRNNTVEIIATVELIYWYQSV